MSIDYFKAFVAYNRLTRWALYYENPVCVKSMLNQDYWFAMDQISKQAKDDSSNVLLYVCIIAGVVVVGALVIVAVMCIRKRQSDTDEDEDKTAKLAADLYGKT